MSGFRLNTDLINKALLPHVNVGEQRLVIPDVTKRTKLEKSQTDLDGRDIWNLEETTPVPFDGIWWNNAGYSNFSSEGVKDKIYKNNKAILATQRTLPTIEQINKAKGETQEQVLIKIPNIPTIPKELIMRDNAVVNVNDVNYEDLQNYMLNQLDQEEAEDLVGGLPPNTVAVKIATGDILNLPNVKRVQTFEPSLNYAPNQQDLLNAMFRQQGNNLGAIDAITRPDNNVGNVRKSKATFVFHKNIFDTQFGQVNKGPTVEDLLEKQTVNDEAIAKLLQQMLDEQGAKRSSKKLEDDSDDEGPVKPRKKL